MRRRWRSEEQVEKEPAEERQGLMGQLAGQTKGERAEKMGGGMKGADWTGTAGQEGWEVELPGPGLGSEGAGGQVELEEEACHKVTPH